MLSSLNKFYQSNRFGLSPAVWVLLLLHVVGIVGMKSAFRETFVSLTSLHLFFVLMICIIEYYPREQVKAAIGFCLIYLVGFSAELLGIQTGFPFGNYVYSNRMGLKIFDTPMQIGMIWFLVTHLSAQIAWKFPWSSVNHLWLRVLISSLLLTLMDFALEPAAMSMGLWSWEIGNPPLQNYVGWFGTGLITSALYYKFFVKLNSTLSVWTFIIFVFFFIFEQLL